MKQLSLFTKIRRLLRYHIGPIDYVSDSKMNNYVPEVVFDKDVMLYVIKYKPELDVYTMVVQQYNQGLDV